MLLEQDQKYFKGLSKAIVVAVVGTALFIIGGGIYEFRTTKCGQEVTPNPTTSIILTPAPSNETADWKTYRNEEYGFEFKYPESWGEVREKEILSIQEISDEESNLYKGIDLGKVVEKEFHIEFNGDKCNLAVWCDVGLKLIRYDDNRYLQLYCYEGQCYTTSILGYKEEIQYKSNTFIGGRDGLINDTYFPPGNNYQRSFNVILPTYKLELEAGYSRPPDFKGSFFDEEDKSIEDEIQDNPNSKYITDLESFLHALNVVVSSIKFID